MKAINAIRRHIQNIPTGEPFSAASLRNMASTDNVRQILNRMVKNSEIRRISRGIFVKPKITPYIGEVVPEASKVVETIAQTTGEKISIHGSEAARILNLTTQMPIQPIFYTTGTTREVTSGNIKIALKHISPRKLVAVGTIVGTVILALWYLGNNSVSAKTISIIETELEKKEFQKVIAAISQMPAWMANLFYQYQNRNST